MIAILTPSSENAGATNPELAVADPMTLTVTVPFFMKSSSSDVPAYASESSSVPDSDASAVAEASECARLNPISAAAALTPLVAAALVASDLVL